MPVVSLLGKGRKTDLKQEIARKARRKENVAEDYASREERRKK